MTDNTKAPVYLDSEAGRPLHELIDSGLLWLVNATVFHPRGLALALHFDGLEDPSSDNADIVGWSLVAAEPGEPFTFPDSPEVHERFRRAEHMMRLATEGLL
jgi:hypothetical protein